MAQGLRTYSVDYRLHHETSPSSSYGSSNKPPKKHAFLATSALSRPTSSPSPSLKRQKLLDTLPLPLLRLSGPSLLRLTPFAPLSPCNKCSIAL